MNLVYKRNTATRAEIHAHLQECDDNFDPPLSSRVDLIAYSAKIHENSVTFEAWDNQVLVGMMNAYFNDMENNFGYITNVSVIKDHMGKGIAAALLEECMEYAREHHFARIKLEVSKNNDRAIHLYEKAGFRGLEARDNTVLMNYEVASAGHQK
jgi:ribosomal protein S18 acetylase RimI-like enzyme